MKKNDVKFLFCPRDGIKKRFMMVKLLAFFLFMGIVHVAASERVQEEKVFFKNDQLTIEQIFNVIIQQQHYDIFYSDDELNVKAMVVLPRQTMNVEEAIQLVAGEKYKYQFIGKTIVIGPLNKKDDEKKEIRIVGKVMDIHKQPLPGVTVQVKGLKLGTSTNKEGKYSLLFPKVENPVLVFSFIGMETLEIKYTGKDTIDVVMKEAVELLDEVVVVNTGYQRVDTRKLTSAVTTIKAENIVLPGLNTIDQMLEGHVPGMIFMQNSGQLGATPRLRIRGTSTVLGNQEPLWVVDGIVQTDPVDVDPAQLNDLDFVNLLGNAISGLNPEDIEQIDVLKDASATAIYGARAANGVIVITTKKGKVGPPTINYSFAASFTRRPYYSDRAINVMNSQERIALSREIMEKGIVYKNISTWVGYEGVMRDYYNKKIDYKEMLRQVGKLESVNTDWFDVLMRNAFSHKHTVSVSGGSEHINYYASLGYNDSKGNIKKEYNHLYTANLNLTMNYNRTTVRFQMSGNVAEKRYAPSDINVTEYAYNTSRAVPAYNEDGSLWFYKRSEKESEMYKSQYLFNIINDMEHSWDKTNSNSLNFVFGLNYKLIDPLSLGVTLSYGASNTYHEIYHGEETFLAKTYYTESSSGKYDNFSIMPHGGELKESNQRNNNWMLRGQFDFNKYMDSDERHLITASFGGELSSSRYIGKDQTYLGYMPDRGKKIALINMAKYPKLIEKLTNDASIWGGERKDNLNRLISGYLSISYSYKDLYMFNVNARADASNAFGDQSNDKLNPIWSVSARWNIKDDILKRANWINSLSIRGSFGFQGNMLSSETPELIIRQGNLSPTLNEYASTVFKYPNPNLKWEKTTSMNVTVDFAFLKNKINGTFSYYYKKTKDAFLNKTISEINGVSSYTVNRGTLENSGVEISMNFVPINTISGGNPNGFRWSFDPQIGQVLNKLLDRATNKKDKTFQDEKSITYKDYLNGSVQIAGRPLNTFYSYQFDGLDPQDGRPMFKNIEPEREVEYDEMKMEDVFFTVMERSGTRVPVLQGGIFNTFQYRRFTLSFNLTYSFGSKIRLLSLYPNVSDANGTIAPQPLENARREFLNRWKRPGDEKFTNMPAIISNDEFMKTLTPWWSKSKEYKFSSNIWEMYDNSNIRVVSGNYVKMQSLSFRYNVPTEFCKRLHLKSAYLGFSGTNLFTIASSKLKGQDPATQSGSAGTINMSLRPTYSFNLNVSF